MGDHALTPAAVPVQVYVREPAPLIAYPLGHVALTVAPVVPVKLTVPVVVPVTLEAVQATAE